MRSLKTLDKIIALKEREIKQQRQKVQQIYSKINLINEKIKNFEKQINKYQNINVFSPYQISLIVENVSYLKKQIENYLIARSKIEKVLEKELNKLKDIFAEKKAVETLKSKIEFNINKQEKIKERTLLDEFASRKYISDSS